MEYMFKIYTTGYDDLKEDYNELVEHYNIEIDDNDETEGTIKFDNITDLVLFLNELECPVVMTSTTIEIYDKYRE